MEIAPALWSWIAFLRVAVSRFVALANILIVS